MKVYVLLAGVGEDQQQSLGSVHATPEGAMAKVAAQYPGTDIKWEHHDSHGESWYCKFYIAPFWHEFGISAEEVIES